MAKKKSYYEWMKEEYGHYNKYEEQVSAINARKEAERKADEAAKAEAAKAEAAAKAKTEERTWFTGGAFSDGYQFGDLTKTILGTGYDLITDVGGGALEIGEGFVDTGAYIIGAGADLFGADDFADQTKKFIANDLYSGEEVASRVFSLGMLGADEVDKVSVLGEKVDSLAQSGGQLAATIGLQMVGVPWWVTSGVTSFGSEVDNAFDNNDVSYLEAGISGAISAGAEMLTEKLFGGSGLGEKGLINLEPLTKGISNKLVKTLADLGLDMAAEGTEEVVSSVASRLGSALYREENIGELLASEDAFDEYLESFIGGAALGGIMNASNAGGSHKQGTDYRTGLTDSEHKVFDKAYEKALADAEKQGKTLSKQDKARIYDNVLSDLKKGGISTDVIEEALGGDSYTEYKNNLDREAELQKTIDELENLPASQITVKQSEQLEKARLDLADHYGNSNQDTLKAKLSETVQSLAKQEGERLKNRGSFITESYNERARRGQAFEADLSKYENEKEKELVQKAVDSGILNNTRRTHELVDMLAKLSKDKGVLFDFTNNEKIKNSSFAVDGKTVNGYVTEDGYIALNTDSSKYLSSVAGHEITHILEGTEFYSELQKAAFAYAESKGEYKSRYDALSKLYKGVKGYDGDTKTFSEKINKELTADLVGDYLFQDSDFIRKLSTENRNVFQKIYDEIKYLYKVATAGSKEARELERVKKIFDDIYRESGKAKTEAKPGTDGNVKFSLESKTQPGKLDPRTVTRSDVVDMLNRVDEGTIYGDTYIPIRINTPSTLIYWASQRRGDVIDNNPIAISAEKAFNAMNRPGETESGRPNMLSVDDMVAMIESMNDPQYIVYQGANDRYVEVVQFNTTNGDTAFAVIEVGNDKNASHMNGYEGGLYNILVTTYPPKSGKLKELLNNSNNQVIYDKKKDASQRTSSSTVPSVLNDASFFEDSLPNSEDSVNRKFSISDSDGNKSFNTKQKQLEIINKTNPMWDDYHTGIRTTDDIRTWDEVLELDDERDGQFVWGDFSRADAEQALKDGAITVYSSYPIKNGVFVSTSYIQAQEYAGGKNGKVYSKTIPLTDVAWINGDEGQYAEVTAVNSDVGYSLSEDSKGREVGDAVQTRFAKTKVVDENGRLKVVYHGTASGEFTIFDKARGSVEGDFGSGFYFTDNEYDVSEHYEGGGPDFENKVGRRADQIWNENPDLSYEEAEERAYKELYQGSHKFEVYLNIENPAIVGETKLFEQDSYFSEYNQEDYDNEDDYYSDVEQLVADDIDNIIWEIDRNVDVNSTDGIAEILWEAFNEGGVDIETLKSKINNLYLEDSEGNLVGNEVARQIIESWGYDGIIDPTVSGKWNMEMEEGTTHYIVFKPNQIKSVTNQNPTDNPDINLSLSNPGEAPVKYGDLTTTGEDVRLKKAQTESFENIGPIREDLQTTSDDIAPLAEDIAPVSDVAIKPKREAKQSNEPRMIRADSNNGRPGEKRRKWVKTSTRSEAVDGKVLPDDLNQNTIHYQPISNKTTLGNANEKLGNMGYDTAVSYFNSQFANKKISLDDVALGERLIQEAVKRGDTKTAGELIQNVAILGTELGQKVQALSIIKRLTPEGQLGMLQKIVERGKTKGDKAYEGVELTQDMIDKILNTYGEDGSYDQAKLNEAVEDVKQQIADQMDVTKLDKVNAWRYLSMLGNPKTHIRNLVSNVAMNATAAVKNVVARTIEGSANAVANVFGFDAPIKNRTKTWKAATDEVKAFAQKTTEEMKDVISDGGKYSEDASIKAKRAIFKNKILNGLYEFNSDMLTKEDWWFSKSAFNGALREYLTANGIRTKQDIQNNPKIIEQAKQYATEQSQIATFRQYSWLANKINDIENRNTATSIAVGAILPFKKTPINIAKAGLNYSPLGFAKTLTYDISQVKKGKMEASELVDHLAQNITGSALTLAGYMLASSGLLSGGGEDDKEGDYDYQLGEQTYSVNIDGKSYSLSWLSPVAMPLFVGANAYEQLVEGKEWNGDVVVETLAQTLDPLSEMSFLSGLNQVLTSYDSGIEKFAGIGQSMAQNYATQFVPTLSSQIATVMDDTKRSTKVAGDSDFKFVDETINKLKLKIPGLRETLEPSTDIWGNEVKLTEDLITRAVETFIAPYSVKDNIATEIDAEIKSLYSAVGDNGLIPSVPDNYVKYKDEKYKMSAAEYTDFKKAYGQTAYNMLTDLFDTKTYQNASAEDKAKWVNAVYDYARDEAKKDFLAGKGVNYTNATKDKVEIYKENAIKGAIENDMTPDEYSFSVEYPEKYSFFKENGITYEDYASADEDGKRAYTWAAENPGKFKVANAISNNVIEYRTLVSELYDLKADKDSNGKTISGSAKEKKVEYINNLNLDYGQKIILFKSLYEADDTYNYDIVEYLNSRNDISYAEMKTILEELGFTVHANGNVTW